MPFRYHNFPVHQKAQSQSWQEFARPSLRCPVLRSYSRPRCLHSRTTNTGSRGSTDVTSTAIRSLLPDKMLINANQAWCQGTSAVSPAERRHICNGSYGAGRTRIAFATLPSLWTEYIPTHVSECPHFLEISTFDTQLPFQLQFP